MRLLLLFIGDEQRDELGWTDIYACQPFAPVHQIPSPMSEEMILNREVLDAVVPTFSLLVSRSLDAFSM